MIQGLFKSRIMTIHSIYWSFSVLFLRFSFNWHLYSIIDGWKRCQEIDTFISSYAVQVRFKRAFLKKKNIEIPTSWSTLLQQRAISSYCSRVLCHCHDGSETLLRGREWKDCTTFNNNRHFFAFQVQTLSYLVTTERN